MTEENLQVRLDKWLWAARFFKTRAIARAQIEGGKVHYNQARTKPGKIVKINDTLTIRQGYSEKIIIIKNLSDKRGPFAQASKLYEETAESISNREKQIELIKMNKSNLAPAKKPTKKQRRDIIAFKSKQEL